MVYSWKTWKQGIHFDNDPRNIDESHQDVVIVEEIKRKFMEEVNLNRERVVFAKYKDNLGFNRYRFVGVFKEGRRDRYLIPVLELFKEESMKEQTY